eukprot:UN24177
MRSLKYNHKRKFTNVNKDLDNGSIYASMFKVESSTPDVINLLNAHRQRDKKSHYWGVHWKKHQQVWTGSCTLNHKKIYVCCGSNEMKIAATLRKQVKSWISMGYNILHYWGCPRDIIQLEDDVHEVMCHLDRDYMVNVPEATE